MQLTMRHSEQDVPSRCSSYIAKARLHGMEGWRPCAKRMAGSEEGTLEMGFRVLTQGCLKLRHGLSEFA